VRDWLPLLTPSVQSNFATRLPLPIKVIHSIKFIHSNRLSRFEGFLLIVLIFVSTNFSLYSPNFSLGLAVLVVKVIKFLSLRFLIALWTVDRRSLRESRLWSASSPSWLAWPRRPGESRIETIGLDYKKRTWNDLSINVRVFVERCGLNYSKCGSRIEKGRKNFKIT